MISFKFMIFFVPPWRKWATTQNLGFPPMIDDCRPPHSVVPVPLTIPLPAALAVVSLTASRPLAATPVWPLTIPWPWTICNTRKRQTFDLDPQGLLNAHLLFSKSRNSWSPRHAECLAGSWWESYICRHLQLWTAWLARLQSPMSQWHSHTPLQYKNKL